MTARLALLGIGLLVSAFVATSPEAVEPLCPSGSSPRSDITWCADFESLSNCTTGAEQACWSDHGFNLTPNPTNSPYLWKVTTTGGAAVGSGYASGSTQPGSTGPSQAYREPIQGTKFLSINVRHYIRYSGGFLAFYSGHGPPGALAYNDNFQCSAAIKLQHSPYTGNGHYDGVASCGGGLDSLNLVPNQGPWPIMRNNRWYAVEVHARIDDNCTDMVSVPKTGCNGVIRIWVDDVLTHEYLGQNLGGVQSGNQLKWYSIFPVTGYMHFSAPPWSGTISIDNIVVSNTGTKIGLAAGANPPGTADPTSPYYLSLGYMGWFGRHTRSDCTSNGYLGPYHHAQYRSGGSLDPTITHGTYGAASDCENVYSWVTGQLSSPFPNTLINITDTTGGGVGASCAGGGSTTRTCRWDGAAWVVTNATDNALKINLTSNSDGGGVQNERGDTYVFPQYSTHGWIYLPSSNNYTVTNLALTGFNSNFFGADFYVALSVSGGNWSVNQRTSGTNAALVSSTPVTFNAWHQYELIIWNNNQVSLMIDGARLYDKATLSLSTAWAFSANQPFMVAGVIDFQGTAPFVAYFDDTSFSSVSYWSCDGWGAASCPFGAGGTPPAAPAGLTAR